jgi:hypothetical protein
MEIKVSPEAEGIPVVESSEPNDDSTAMLKLLCVTAIV